MRERKQLSLLLCFLFSGEKARRGEFFLKKGKQKRKKKLAILERGSEERGCGSLREEVVLRHPRAFLSIVLLGILLLAHLLA